MDVGIIYKANRYDFDIVGYLKTPKIKIGHTGTLDPCAVGVLPVCRQGNQGCCLIDKDKTYKPS